MTKALEKHDDSCSSNPGSDKMSSLAPMLGKKQKTTTPVNGARVVTIYDNTKNIVDAN